MFPTAGCSFTFQTLLLYTNVCTPPSPTVTFNMGDDDPHATQRRRVDEARPVWLNDVLAEVRSGLRQEMQAEMQKLRAELSALSLSPPPRVYPESPTPEAWNLLVSDPDLPPIVTPLLVALAGAAPTVLDEAISEKFHVAYTHLLSLRQQPPCTAASITSRPSRSNSAHSRAGLQDFDGRQVYVSNAGTVYDISRPPPRPCRTCNEMHWSFHCPRRNATLSSSQRNSRMGAGPATPHSFQ